MASALQCLNSIDHLAHFILAREYSMESHPACATFQLLVRRLRTSDAAYVHPGPLREVMAQHNEIFRSHNQQDAQEFLSSLIDTLHAELNQPAPNNALADALAPANGDTRDGNTSDATLRASLAWQRFAAHNRSPIVDLFYGQLQSTLRCSVCSTKSVSYDAFNILSLSLKLTPLEEQQHRELLRMQMEQEALHNSFDGYMLNVSVFPFDTNRASPFMCKVLVASGELASSLIARIRDNQRVAKVLEACVPNSSESSFLLAAVYQGRFLREVLHTESLDEYSTREADIHLCLYHLPSRCAQPPADTLLCVAQYVVDDIIGLPEFIYVPATVTHAQLYDLIEEKMLSTVRLAYSRRLPFVEERCRARALELHSSDSDSDDSTRTPEREESFFECMERLQRKRKKTDKRTYPFTLIITDEFGTEIDPSNRPVPLSRSIVEFPSLATETTMTLAKDAACRAPAEHSSTVHIRLMWHLEVSDYQVTDELCNALLSRKYKSIDIKSPPLLPISGATQSLDDQRHADKSAKDDAKKRYYTTEGAEIEDDTVTINELIEEFMQGELLDGDNRWHCPTCKCKQVATKQLALSRCPRYLIIQLKRFKHDMYGQISAKIKRKVYYPAYNLDMKPFCDATDRPVAMYTLRATISHRGEVDNGHYMGNARIIDPDIVTSAGVNDASSPLDNWFRFDDTYVMPLRREYVISNITYILFYELDPLPENI